MNYVEFRLTVPIGALVGEDFKDRVEICAVCEQLGITRLEESLGEQYDSFFDFASARYLGDPNGRSGHGDVRVFQADSDDQIFLSVDMFSEATDQMNTVQVGVRCTEFQDAIVSMLLRTIRLDAEVSSALLKGNLGIGEELATRKFPRKVDNNGNTTLQHISIYRSGKLLWSSREAEQGAAGDRGNRY
jgi:hypothetical protein